MNTMHFLACVVSLAAFAGADVSHLKQSGFALNSLSSDDQNHVAIKFSNAGNDQNSNSRYWWMNTKSSPFTKTQNNNEQNQIYNTFQTVADAGDIHQTQNILHETHQQIYSQNPFLNVKTQQQTPQQNNHIYENMATLSGSPSEVNNLMLDTKQTKNIVDSYRPVQKIPCYGATQVCAPKDVCNNGFIRERDLGLVLSQANNCDSQVESCCNILPDAAPESDQSPPCNDANAACVSSKFCFNGFIDQSVEHQAVRSTTGFCNAPDVCCRLSDRRRQAPSFQDSDFAAASTSEVLTKEGYVVNVPTNQYLPSFPEPEFNPDASNDDPSRLKPEIPATQPAPTSRPIAQTTAYQPTVPPTYQPQPTTQGPTQTPIRVNTVTNAPYQPPATTQRPYQPTVTTQSPYQPPVTTQRPYQPPATTQRPYQPQANNPRPSAVFQDQAITIVPAACPAAMNCTLIEYCSAIAVISKTPVILTDFQKEYRVPMTDCMIMPSRELGKCCRDPDYTDPWPIGRMGQYNADELNAVFDSGAYKPERQNTVSKRSSLRVQANSNQNDAVATNQVITRVSAPVIQQKAVQPPRPYREIPVAPVAPQQTNVQSVQPIQGSCGVRNYNTQPRGKAPLGTGFGEFTWVAMVILESKKALLCGGSIIDKNVVATSANCVHGHRQNDVLIKAGEWRLGSDEEPKPFQIVRVQKIVFHPRFQPQTLENDIALLYLENDIKYDSHIGPICLDEAESISSPSDDCVTTGWGKEVLKVHLGNALMQFTRVSVLPQADCQTQLQSSRLGYTDSLICGATQENACEVDVGSALACANSSGRYTLKGVYSSETGCQEPNQVVAYTKTDLQWVRETLRNPSRTAFNY